MQLCIHINVDTQYIRTYTYVHAHIHTQTHIHTYIHTKIHTYIDMYAEQVLIFYHLKTRRYVNTVHI